MSFILDALKKSEAERRQGEVPKLQNEPLAPPPRRRPTWPLLLALALLLNGVVLGWWLLSRAEKPALVAMADGDRAGGSGPAGPTAETHAERATDTQVETAPGSDAVSGTPAPSQTVATPLPLAEPEVVEVAVGESPVPAAPASAVPAQGKAVEKQASAPREEPSPAASARPKAASAAPAAAAYPPLSELPANVRSGLPGLDLQLHFFTPEPERRLVRLNGLNLREGDRGGEGLSIVEITPDGIKLVQGGVRFFLPAGRR